VGVPGFRDDLQAQWVDQMAKMSELAIEGGPADREVGHLESQKLLVVDGAREVLH
jgi:hypothetical protein